MAQISKKLEEKVKIIFARHLADKVFFFTSDGQAFREENDATNHAKTLTAKEVTKITRQMVNSGNFSIDQTVEDTTDKPLLPNGAKNEFQAQGGAKESTSGKPAGEPEITSGKASGDPEKTEAEKERAALEARYTELAGKKPVHNISDEKLKEAVADLEQETQNENENEGGK